MGNVHMLTERFAERLFRDVAADSRLCPFCRGAVTGWSADTKAAKEMAKNSETVVKSLLPISFSHGRTALHMAVQSRDADLVRAMASHVPPVEMATARDNTGKTAFDQVLPVDWKEYPKLEGHQLMLSQHSPHPLWIQKTGSPPSYEPFLPVVQSTSGGGEAERPRPLTEDGQPPAEATIDGRHFTLVHLANIKTAAGAAGAAGAAAPHEDACAVVVDEKGELLVVKVVNENATYCLEPIAVIGGICASASTMKRAGRWIGDTAGFGCLRLPGAKPDHMLMSYDGRSDSFRLHAIGGDVEVMQPDGKCQIVHASPDGASSVVLQPGSQFRAQAADRREGDGSGAATRSSGAEDLESGWVDFRVQWEERRFTAPSKQDADAHFDAHSAISRCNTTRLVRINFTQQGPNAADPPQGPQGKVWTQEVLVTPGGILIGSSPDSGIVYPSGLNISRQHAVLYIDESGGLAIEDDGSCYGTTVGDDGEKLPPRTPRRLVKGSRVAWGGAHRLGEKAPQGFRIDAISLPIAYGNQEALRDYLVSIGRQDLAAALSRGATTSHQL